MLLARSFLSRAVFSHSLLCTRLEKSPVTELAFVSPLRTLPSLSPPAVPLAWFISPLSPRLDIELDEELQERDWRVVSVTTGCTSTLSPLSEAR